jgi:hypothetical protein
VLGELLELCDLALTLGPRGVVGCEGFDQAGYPIADL